MSAPSTLTLALGAGVSAGLVAALITRAIEHFGGKRGGILGTLPTTIVPASVGLWLNSPEHFMEAMCAVPPGMCLNALFLWLWRALPPRLPSRLTLNAQLALMSALSLLMWALGASLWVSLARPALSPLSGGLGGALSLLALGLWASEPSAQSLKGSTPVSWGTLISRGLAAGLAVGASVWLSKVTSGVIAGVAAVFPAIFWTSMVSVWRSQGAAVSSGAVGPMMLGASSVALYALLSLITFPTLGPGLGALCAWFGAVLCVSWPADWWLHREVRSTKRALNKGGAL
jgi:hypothetical protein